jgi:hypothetical protein
MDQDQFAGICPGCGRHAKKIRKCPHCKQPKCETCDKGSDHPCNVCVIKEIPGPDKSTSDQIEIGGEG